MNKLTPAFRPLLPLVLALCTACSQPARPVAAGVFAQAEGEGAPAEAEAYDLADIQQMGELIVLTLYGPITYFEFRGGQFGPQYMLAESYARSIGVTTRVEVCRSADEMLRKLADGEGDLIAAGMPLGEGAVPPGVRPCGADGLTRLVDTLASMEHDRSLLAADSCAWMVRSHSAELAASLDAWFRAHASGLMALCTPEVADEDGTVIAARRHPASPMRDAARGVISAYDHLFRAYAAQCGWDWRLLAAQAYQESAFDAGAVSWMGARGLLQLMPATADMVGVARRDLFNAERNVEGATRFLRFLQRHYSGIANGSDRINFVLAAYNAGPGHVDDARRLAGKYGRNPDRWADVEQYVLRMSEPRYYNDAVVSHGYFRGRETYNYVRDIRTRWDDYKNKVRAARDRNGEEE